MPLSKIKKTKQKTSSESSNNGLNQWNKIQITQKKKVITKHLVNNNYNNRIISISCGFFYVGRCLMVHLVNRETCILFETR